MLPIDRNIDFDTETNEGPLAALLNSFGISAQVTIDSTLDEENGTETLAIDADIDYELFGFIDTAFEFDGTAEVDLNTGDVELTGTRGIFASINFGTDEEPNPFTLLDSEIEVDEEFRVPLFDFDGFLS
ncbi:MAG: hypothetical protein ACFBRM_00935 [Pikeienuella sp.]